MKVEVVFGGPWNYMSFGVTCKRPKSEYGPDVTWDHLNHNWSKYLTVVGNIYAHPKLLAITKKEQFPITKEDKNG